ncbi:hypothetical protein [Mesorhizobium sp. 131-2-1]|uniref:hypothetical protein n=1 Tax=Mesorhizobium sp. 131-2-1 TaxID=2744518 RepID=UPI0019265D9B|nr:hypothetical protein [Mesorhizobium sp. 131-2-1]
MLVIVFLLFQIVLEQREPPQRPFLASDLSKNRCAPLPLVLLSGENQEGPAHD